MIPCFWAAQRLPVTNGRRTEQAKANLDPRVGPRVAPRVGPRVAPRVRPREPPREHPRGLISLFSALQGLPTKHPTKVSTEGPTSGRSGFTCPVFTCSVLCLLECKESGTHIAGFRRWDGALQCESDSS